jgi:hypothetical protein
MKSPFVALSAVILAMEICTCGPLLSDNLISPRQPVQRAAKQQSTGQTKVKNAWSIGIYTGSSPFQLSAPANIKNPVLTAEDVTDLDVNIVAHPFMVVTDSLYYLFFTAKNDISQEYSGIGLAESKNGINWKYRQIVLKEPFVLAYPYVFKWQNDYYMIPEAHTETSVRLYRATDFPYRWTYEKDLITGDHFISASVVQYAGMWWMFVARSGNETLRLFYAADLKGPWNEHPLSPIVQKDANIARPGGRPLVIDGTLYRIGQDCYPTYGYQVFAFQITDISTTTYKEKRIDTPLVRATSEGWNADAMHHVDLHQISKNKWIAAVDGNGPIKQK